MRTRGFFVEDDVGNDRVEGAGDGRHPRQRHSATGRLLDLQMTWLLRRLCNSSNGMITCNVGLA